MTDTSSSVDGVVKFSGGSEGQPALSTPNSTDGDARTPASHVVLTDSETSSHSEKTSGFNHGRRFYESLSSSIGSMQELNFGRYDRRQQVLRLEFISDDDARRGLFVLKCSAVLGILATIILTVLRSLDSAHDYFVLNVGFHVSNVVIGAAMLLLLLPYFGCWLYHIYRSVCSGKTWSHRRKAGAASSFVRTSAMSVILILFVVVNVVVLADAGMWCSGAAVPITAFFTWTAWNVLFCMMMYDAHCLVAVDGGEGARKDFTVRDKPFWWHWPKLILFLATEGTLIWTIVQDMDSSVISIKQADGDGKCEWNDRLECSPKKGIVISSALTLAGFVLYWLLSVRHVLVAWRQVHGKPYLEYKVAHSMIRIQVRFMISFTIVIVSAIILWLAGGDACVKYALSWFGMLPMTIIMTGHQWLGMFLTLPRRPDEPPPKMNELYQQFAWTESSKPRQIERRNRLFLEPIADDEPMFCVETAIKLFYWATLIYHFTEPDGHNFSALPQSVREMLGEVENGMDLYKLVKRRLFYDRTLETKILCAWSENIIVISIRGSAARSNFVADAQLLQVPHPPARKFEGKTPRVHNGFLKTWHAARINELVIRHVSALLDSAENRDEVQVKLTGHSLGGAVAILAAYDIATQCNLRRDQLMVYTVGAPRVGNRTFAKEYIATVPDTWNVINDQDLVTRSMKLYGLYKRAGHRVIINSVGDLIVRPSIFEVSLMQMPFRSSAAHHLTRSYRIAFAAVLHSQIDKVKRQREGIVGVLELLHSVPVIHEVLEVYAEKKGISLADQFRSLSLRTLAADGTSMRHTRGPSGRLDAAVAAAVLDSPLKRDSAGGIAYESVFDGQIKRPEESARTETTEATERRDSQAAPEATDSRPTGARVGLPAAQPNLRAHPSLWDALRRGFRSEPRRSSEAAADTHGSVAVTMDGRGEAGGAAGITLPSRPPPFYKIPEEEHSEHAGGGGAREGKAPYIETDPGMVWHCPLTAAPENLPANAKLTMDGIVEIGALPDMKTCSLLKRSRMASTAAGASGGVCPGA